MAEARVSSRMPLASDRPESVPAPWKWNDVLTVGVVLRGLLIAGLILWAYWKFLNPFDFNGNGVPDGIWTSAWEKPAWSHGWLIIPLAAMLVHFRLQERAPRRVAPSLWGLGVILFGMVVRQVALVTRFGYPGQVTFVFLVGGVILWLLGWEMFKRVWVAPVYLLLQIPLGPKYFEGIALPLQQASAMATEFFLGALGRTVGRVDNVLYIASMPDGLHVAGPCSGLHLLFAFVALGVLMAFISRRVWWERLAIVVSSFPIAVLCNFVRVTLMAILSDVLYFGAQSITAGRSTWVSVLRLSPAQLEGIRRAVLDPDSLTHQSFGFAMLGLAFLLMWVELRILERLFLVDDAEKPADGVKP